MHPRNRHKDGYDFKALIKSSPELAGFVAVNKFNNESIDFSDPNAVKALNKALLKFYYRIESWDIPKNYLCPPVPGRADYLHYLSDLIGAKGNKVRGLDIGTGANCIYPLIGFAEFGWQFVGSDVDGTAVKSAQKIISDNPSLVGAIEVRQQTSPRNIFIGIIKENDSFDFTMCNPPFHGSQAEALQGTTRKWKNLGKDKKAGLNFGGQSHELWCEGGEKAFVGKMIEESLIYKNNCRWFTTLISKEAHLPLFKNLIKNAKATQIKILEMTQGQKKSRILAWSFQD